MSNAPIVPPSPGQRLLKKAFRDDETEDEIPHDASISDDDDLDGTDFDLTPVPVSEFARDEAQGLHGRGTGNGQGGDARHGGRNLRTCFGHDLSDVPEFLSSSQELTWISDAQEEAMKRARPTRATIHARAVTKSSDRFKEYKQYCRKCIRRRQNFLTFRQWWAAHKTELIRTYTPTSSPTRAGGGGTDGGAHGHQTAQGHRSVDDPSEFESSLDFNMSSSLESSQNPTGPQANNRHPPTQPPRQPQTQTPLKQHRRSRSGSQLQLKNLQPTAAQQNSQNSLQHQRTRSTSSVTGLSVGTSGSNSKQASPVGGSPEAITPPGVKGQKLLRTIGSSPKKSDMLKRDSVVQAQPELPQAAEQAARRATDRRERSRSRSVSVANRQGGTIPMHGDAAAGGDGLDTRAQQSDKSPQSQPPMPKRKSPPPQPAAMAVDDNANPIKVIERAKQALQVEAEQYEHLQVEVNEEQHHAKKALQQRLAQRKREAHSRSNSNTSNGSRSGGQQGAPAISAVGAKATATKPPIPPVAALDLQGTQHNRHHRTHQKLHGGSESSRSSTPSPTHSQQNSRSMSSDLSVGFGGRSGCSLGLHTPCGNLRVIL